MRGTGVLGAVLSAFLVIGGAVGALADETTAVAAPDVRCANQQATIVGSGAAETLVGTSGDDVIVARGGGDTIRAGGGHDVVCGGDGADEILGGEGPDLLLGGGGNDLADGQVGTDSCNAETEISCVPNEAPTNIGLSDASVAENQPAGTVVGNLSAADPNPADEHFFRLVDGPGSANNELFRIHGRQLRTRQAFDFETKNKYNVRVRVRDFAAPIKSYSEALVITIVDANELPTVMTSAGSTAFTENGASVVIDNALTIDDVDDTVLEGATVSVSGNHQAADRLVFVDTPNITGTYNTGTGVLTLTGTDSLADYQAALRSIKFNYVGDDPVTSKTISFVVSDGSGNSAPATKAISITPVNDAPTITSTGTPLEYRENAGAVAVDPDLTLSDPDSGQLVGATVQITDNFFGSQDDLIFVDQLGITGSYNDSTGTLTLTGASSLANYRTALRSVAFRNNHDNPNTQTRTVSFQVMDGGSVNNLSNVATRDIDIDAVNDAPDLETSAGATAYDFTPGDPVVVDPNLIVQNDPDDTNLEGATIRISQGFESGDELIFADTASISGGYNTGTGVLTLTGTASEADYQAALRSIQYDHVDGTAPTSATKVIEFRASDGSANSNPETKSITIT